MKEEQSTGEKIVEMLCNGNTVKQIQSELGISHKTLEDKLTKVRYGAGLPYHKRTYKARKDDIMANVDKWKTHRKRILEIEQEYRESLVSFDN